MISLDLPNIFIHSLIHSCIHSFIKSFLNTYYALGTVLVCRTRETRVDLSLPMLLPSDHSDRVHR